MPFPIPDPNDPNDAIGIIQDAVAEMMNEEETVDLGRQMQYVQEGDEGMEVEYWQVRIIEAVKQVRFYGNSNAAFVAAEAPIIAFKTWDTQMTAYLSAWTGRNSYGVGPTERVMIENAIHNFYN